MALPKLFSCMLVCKIKTNASHLLNNHLRGYQGILLSNASHPARIWGYDQSSLSLSGRWLTLFWKSGGTVC